MSTYVVVYVEFCCGVLEGSRILVCKELCELVCLQNALLG
jgi:hypothetical protein